MTFKSIIFLLFSLFSSWLWANPQGCGEKCGQLSEATAAPELGQISAEQLQSMQQNDQALVVDIRTQAEWQATGVIPNSRKLQSFDSDGQFDSAKWLADLQKLKTSPDQPVILVCRSGNRSRKVGELLVERGIPKVYHLNNGIQGWIKSGHPVNSD